MGKLTELEQWDEDIYQIETSDPVLGGRRVFPTVRKSNWPTARNGLKNSSKTQIMPWPNTKNPATTLTPP